MTPSPPLSLLRLLVALWIAFLCSHASFASAAGPSSPRAPYDPRDFTMALGNEERADRAANTPGGEVSFCCCYCGRGGSEANARGDSTADPQLQSQFESEADAAAARQAQVEQDEDAAAAGIASQDAWLYASLPSQPRPESGDPTDRLAQRRRRRRRRRRQREAQARRKQRGRSPKGRTHSGLDPSADGAESYNRNSSSLLPSGESASSLASFSIFPSLESGCDNEGCAESSSLCRSSHLWTGWAGDFGLSTSSEDAVRAKCQSLYAREMEVLNDFNKLMEREMAQEAPATPTPNAP